MTWSREKYAEPDYTTSWSQLTLAEILPRTWQTLKKQAIRMLAGLTAAQYLNHDVQIFRRDGMGLWLAANKIALVV